MGHFSISRAPFTLFALLPTHWNLTPVVRRFPFTLLSLCVVPPSRGNIIRKKWKCRVTSEL